MPAWPLALSLLARFPRKGKKGTSIILPAASWKRRTVREDMGVPFSSFGTDLERGIYWLSLTAVP